MAEPPSKRARAEETEGQEKESASSPWTAKTVFVTCKHIHSRGELVNAFFYLHREELGLATAEDGWYLSEGRLNRHAPLEVVHVKNSKRPFFLVEWRYPTQEELERRRKPTNNSTEDADDLHLAGDDGDTPMKHQSAEALAGYADRLLALGERHGDGELVHKEAPVKIMPAMAGVTVASERAKLLLRDEERRRAQVESARAEGPAQGRGKRAAPPPPAATTTSFVPRTVRRR